MRKWFLFHFILVVCTWFLLTFYDVNPIWWGIYFIGSSLEINSNGFVWFLLKFHWKFERSLIIESSSNVVIAKEWRKSHNWVHGGSKTLSIYRKNTWNLINFCQSKTTVIVRFKHLNTPVWKQIFLMDVCSKLLNRFFIEFLSENCVVSDMSYGKLITIEFNVEGWFGGKAVQRFFDDFWHEIFIQISAN